MNQRNCLKDAKRIVIKVGTSTLTHSNGALNFTTIEKLVRVITDIENQGKEVILVTSGAIGVGTRLLNLAEKPKTTKEKQAVAAVGQCELMHIYSKFFLEYHYKVGQILLTPHVIEDQVLRDNAVNTFETLLQMKIIPVVNENDSVAVEEIEFGDNDTLSAHVAALVNADLLILLSDIDGLYTADPRKDSSASLVSYVDDITNEIENSAGGRGSDFGTGGMITKIYAAKFANSFGVPMVIARGSDPRIIWDILEGKSIGTLFYSNQKEQ